MRSHSDAVSEYVTAVADRLDLEPERRETLIFASLLHDVGKLGISERILLKPARLTDEERSIVQLHPRIGARLVGQVPALQSLAPAVLHHHERFAGDGYPGRLRGETIPLEARIIAIADSFSAMTSERPYSSPRTPEDACAELERCAGEQFDPELVRLFVEEVRRRAPDQLMAPRATEELELDLHRRDGEFVLGGPAFGSPTRSPFCTHTVTSTRQRADGDDAARRAHGTPKLAIGAAAWRSGDDGERVIDRALDATSGPTPVAS